MSRRPPMMIVAAVATLAAGAATAQNNVSPQATAAPAGPSGIPVQSPELQFVPIPACRVFDTGAPLGEARAFSISGTANMKPQGGPAGGCGVPVWATAVAISLTTSSGDGSGYFAAYPTGRLPTSNAAVSFNSTTSDTAGLSVAINSHQLTLKPFGGAARVSGDVTGYYAPQIAAIMNSDGTIYSQSGRIVSSARNSDGSYTIDVDRNVQTCTASANIQGGNYYADAYTQNSSVVVSTWALNADAVAVPTNLYFNVSVRC